MKKVAIFAIFIVLVVGAALIFDQKIMNKKQPQKEETVLSGTKGPVRKAFNAGNFYPDNAAELDSMIDGFLSKADLPQLEPNIRAIVVPHAGYVYSGQVAAYAYKALIGKDIERVIIIGNSHQEYFDGVSIYPKGYFETPLGKVEIDADFAQKLMDKNPKIFFKESAHLAEHSLEVQIPFLQKTLKNFTIVPIILGNQPGAADTLINALNGLIDDKTLIIASSDLSHYPDYENAKYSDGKVINAILSGKRENLQKTIAQLESENIPNLQTCACASDAIEVVMALMQGKNINLLNAENSGDITGDKSQVVGYASIIFMDPSTSSGQVQQELDKKQQERLLEIAKQSVETYINIGKIPQIEENDPILNKPLGAFVTLSENGDLRGCIGVFTGDVDEPLYKIVSEMAISAAVNDPRFEPVKKAELGKIDYEISVLSELQKVDSWKDIELGKHGVRIKNGTRGGVFLPQVATENNWDLETFMDTLCTQKAGLPANCWKDPKTEIYVFTAQVFGK